MRYTPSNDNTPARAEGLSAADLAHEIGLKRAENRIVKSKGADGWGARWMLRRLRQRLFSATRGIRK